jgi:hypothetical protein
MFTILAINFDGNMLTSFHCGDGGDDPTDTSATFDVIAKYAFSAIADLK